MISKKHKCIFVHIPKTAGQSIESFFLDLLGLSWDERAQLLMRYNENPKLGPEKLAHLTAHEYIYYNHITKEKFSQYYKFSFVRNPWARLVSEYRWKYARNQSFQNFVLHGLPFKSDYNDSYRHILPQYNFLYDKKGNLLVNFIGKFENLQSDFATVCENLNIDFSHLPFVNPSKAKSNIKKRIKHLLYNRKLRINHYTDYYNNKTKEKVARMYAKDISTFNYKFGS